jgi:hypothetical protein
MNLSRRDVVAASAFAFGHPAFCSAAAPSGARRRRGGGNQSVETLRKALLEPDKAKLAQVTSDQISYGHSDGRVETKEQFINGVMTRKQVVKSLTFPDLKVSVVGNAAIVRHIYLSESELDGKATTTRIGALQVWQKQDGAWKLLARQGFRLPA